MEASEYLLRYLNLRHMRSSGMVVPVEFIGMMDVDMLQKTRDYEADKACFGFISSLFGNLLTVAFIFGPLLNIVNEWTVSLNLPFVISGWLFFVILLLASEILNIPFSLYENFRIENKYGFNTMTLRLWISDFARSLLISVILISIILFAAFGIMQWSSVHWWIWLWGVMLLYGIFIMYISPYVIEPIFNKFTPLEDELLKKKIAALAEKAGISIARIMKMDASRRSRHSNAYFTGIGKTKRIVLYDTLTEGMTQDEIIAVLAHEMGHWKRRHVLKMIVMMEMLMLILLYISFRLMEGDMLAEIFRIGAPSTYAKLVIVGFLCGIASFPLRPLINYFSRHNERQADNDCIYLTGDAESAVAAFIKLAKENLTNLNPHPLYVFFYHSHPPILDRIRYIRGKSGKQEAKPAYS